MDGLRDSLSIRNLVGLQPNDCRFQANLSGEGQKKFRRRLAGRIFSPPPGLIISFKTFPQEDVAVFVLCLPRIRRYGTTPIEPKLRGVRPSRILFSLSWTNRSAPRTPDLSPNPPLPDGHISSVCRLTNCVLDRGPFGPSPTDDVFWVR